MRVFKLDYTWGKKENREYVDRIYDLIRINYTRHNPTTSRAIAERCKLSDFPKVFHRADAIRQLVSYLRRHQGAWIGSNNKGTWYITDKEGWDIATEYVERKLRILQSTHSSLLTSEIKWYKKKRIKRTNEHQRELKL